MNYYAKIYCFLLGVFLFNGNNLLGQFNLVPNPSFENGVGNPPNTTGDLGGLSSWTYAYQQINAGGNCQHIFSGPNYCAVPIGWWDYNYFVSVRQNGVGQPCYPTSNSFTSKCAEIDHSSYGYGGAIQSTLISPVNPYVQYTLKCKMLCYEPNTFVKVYLTDWTTHWASDSYANHKTLIAQFFPPMDCNWATYFTTFNIGVPLQHLTFETAQGGDILLDDVEITQYCPDPLFQQNKSYYTPEPKYEASNIFAGYNVGAPGPVGEVIVQPGADIIYKAGNSVSLEPGFSVKPSGNFHAYLAPCGRDCFVPAAEAGNVADICTQPPYGTTYPLGMLPEQGMTYTWSANPSGASSNLSSTIISNPVFTPPTTGYGTIVYTLTASNSCGEAVSDLVIVNYNFNGALTSYLDVSNFSSNGPTRGIGSNYGSEVSQIKFEVYYPLPSTSLYKTFIVYRGVDFNGSYYYWYYPGDDFGCDIRHYPVKAYYKIYCSNNWNSGVISAGPELYFMGLNDASCDGGGRLANPQAQTEPPTIKNENKEIFFNILPNPNNGSFSITMNDNGLKDIYVYDATGKVVFEKVNTNERTIDVDLKEYAYGIYVVRITNGSYSVAKKIVKE
jgi:hypothetical protein